MADMRGRLGRVSFYTVVALGPVAVTLAVAAGWWWLRRTARRRQPMHPLPILSPWHERPRRPLSVHENTRFHLLAESCKDPDVVAVDPMERP